MENNTNINKDRFSDLSQRVVVASIVISALIVLIYFSTHFFVKIGIIAVVTALSVIALYEYSNFLKKKEIKLPTVFLMCFTALEVVSIYLSSFSKLFSFLPLIILLVGVCILFLYSFNKIQNATVVIANSLFGVFYIAIPLGFLLRILYLSSPCYSGFGGRMWLVYLISVTKITDIAAYFCGKAFGRKKLSPLVSPKKTVAGAVAGLLFALGTSIFFSFLSIFPIGSTFHLTLFQSIYLGLCIGVFSQIGDLSESLLKRDAGIKDSNRIPGIGGVLDLLDSLLFTAPIVYLFLHIC